MKKILAMMLILCVAVTMFVACGEKKEETPVTDQTTTTTDNTTTDNTQKPEDTTTEKPADTTAPAAGAFENATFSVALPTGWTATDEQGYVTIKKSDTEMILVMANPANTDPIEKIAESIKTSMPESTMEDATIGANTFKKITAKVQDKETTNLIAVKGSTGIVITVANFAGTDEQAILSSLVLK